MMKFSIFNFQFSKKGFTLIEMMLVLGVLAILFALLASTFILFVKESKLDNNTEEIINALRRAQNKSLASEGASRYGVYFDNSVSPNQYTLFKGSDYASRNPSFDEVNKLSEEVEISSFFFGGGNSKEVVFDQLTGITSPTYSIFFIYLELKNNPAKNRTIYIESSGQTGLNNPSENPPPASWLEDSRHIHFDYSRLIDTLNENLTLSFEGGIIKTIIIANNMRDGQIYWEGEVDVNGETQKIKIHTHRLNNLDTQICVHRDRRYNNKSLIITISGDTSGSLVDYSSDGSVVNSSSVNVSNLNWE